MSGIRESTDWVGAISVLCITKERNTLSTFDMPEPSLPPLLIVADLPEALTDLCGISLLERMRRIVLHLGFREAMIGAQGREGQCWGDCRFPRRNEGPLRLADPYRIRQFLLRWPPVVLARPSTEQLRSYRLRSTIDYCATFGKFGRPRPAFLCDHALERMVFWEKSRCCASARA